MPQGGHPGDAGKDEIIMAVASALTTREGHGCERGDGQDNLIPMSVTHALTAEGADASEDGPPTLQAGGNDTGGTRPPGTTVDTAESLVPWMDTAATLTAGTSSQGVSAPGRRQEDEHNIVPWALAARDDTFPPLEDQAHPVTGGHGQPGTVAYPLAVRGREGGAQLEIGPEDGPYNALRAADGGSSRTPMIATAYQCHGSNVGPMGTIRVGNGNAGGGVPFMAETASAIRRLTPLECERLMGWPDGHTLIDKTSDSARYKQCGNGIAAPVAEWIGWRLKAYAEGWRP